MSAWVKFHTPLGGCAFACEARMPDDHGAVTQLRLACVQPTEAALGLGFADIASSCNFLNRLLAEGMPWRALAACKASAGALGALIEAAELRRLDAGGSVHAA